MTDWREIRYGLGFPFKKKEKLGKARERIVK
jgi:hypothetical protein